MPVETPIRVGASACRQRLTNEYFPRGNEDMEHRKRFPDPPNVRNPESDRIFGDPYDANHEFRRSNTTYELYYSLEENQLHNQIKKLITGEYN